jgi:basic membrane protein A and related proteins
VAAALVGIIVAVGIGVGLGPTRPPVSDVRVGLAYDIGGLGDKSFNDAAAGGLDRAIEDFGIWAEEVEPNEGDTNRVELLRLLSDEGYDLVIAVGFLFAEAACKAAQDYPDVHYAVVDGFIDENTCEGGSELTANSNVASLLFAEEQGSFLVGAAAALKSETGHIGFIGGVEIDLIKKVEAGYAAGVQQINPAIEIDAQYISRPPDFGGFRDAERARQIASGMYEGGADVVYHAAGASGSGLFEAAVHQSDALGTQLWAIGMDTDQLQTATPDQQAHILTSMLKRVDVAVYRTIEDEVNGESSGGDKTFDLARRGVDYSTSGDYLTREEIDQVEDLKQQIVDGEISVPDAP